jgi:hypothetical protein
VNEFIVLLQQQSVQWRLFIGSVLLVCVAVCMGGLLAILELVLGERE